MEVLCSYLLQGARKDGRGNEPVGSCAMCDALKNGGSKQNFVAYTNFTVTDER